MSQRPAQHNSPAGETSLMSVLQPGAAVSWKDLWAEACASPLWADFYDVLSYHILEDHRILKSWKGPLRTVYNPAPLQ